MRRLMVLFLMVVGASALGASVSSAHVSGGDGAASPRQMTGCFNDADCDGTQDTADKCPTVQGPSPDGCPPPDTDGDGFYDSSDPCPTQAGATTGGCPDADLDGTADSLDKCPTVAGPPSSGGCPPTTDGPVPPGTDPDDTDNDGVVNADDKCANSYDSEKVDADGCGPFRAEAHFGARTTEDMADEPGLQVQCINPKGIPCTFRLTLTLSKASARRLGVGRKIMDVSLKTTKSTMSGKYLYATADSGLRRAVIRAFRRAYNRDTDVTMTFDGTYVRGSGATRPLPQVTFTMKRKVQGGSAYRVEPFISNGPEGPDSGGLTKTDSPDDF